VHELIRQYASERLDGDLAEAHQVRRRHSEYYGAFLQEREGRLHGRGQKEALEEILGDMDNVWAAWDFAVARRHVQAIGDFVEALGYVGRVRGWHQEVHEALRDGAVSLRQQLDLTASQGEHPARKQAAVVLADVLSKEAAMSSRMGRSERAIKLVREALALLCDVEPGARRDRVRIHAKALLGSCLWLSGDSGQGKQLVQEALALAHEVADRWGTELALFELGTFVRNEGWYSEAEGLLEQAIAIANETGERWVKAASLDSLSWVLGAKGEYWRAKVLAEESLQIRQELGDRSRIGFSWARLGGIAKALADYELAGQHYRKGLAVADEIGDPGVKFDCLIGQARASLPVRSVRSSRPGSAYARA